jgi:hypothetical protein
MRQSSPGSARPDLKALDVEVDLLAEWTAERGRNRRENTRALAWLSTPAIAAAVLLPLLFHAHSSAAQRAAAAGRQAAVARAKRATLEARKKAGQTTLDARALKAAFGTECRTAFDDIAEVLNSANQSMAFRSLRCNVTGTTLDIRCEAGADSSLTARRFADGAGRGVGVKCSVISSMRLDPAFGPHGVSFEYVKQQELGK